MSCIMILRSYHVTVFVIPLPKSDSPIKSNTIPEYLVALVL